MKPIRVQLSRVKGWRMPPNTAKVDRATLFGNPYEVRKGTITGGPERWVKRRCYFVGEVGTFYLTKEEAAVKAVEAFRAWVNHPANRKHREMCIVGLRGKKPRMLVQARRAVPRRRAARDRKPLMNDNR